VPLGFQYGLQIDAFVGGADNRSHGDLSAFGTGAHLFWRDPARGLFGVYGRYLHFDALGGVNSYVGAGEGALYLGPVTLDVIAGAETGDNVDTQFLDVARVGYYPTDNILLSVGQSYILGVHSGLAGAEWGFGVGGGTMVSLFANGGLAENGNGTVLGGLRIYFGQRDKSLIRRHREDDPAAINPMEITSVGNVSNLGN
jgi:hypothetical protein